MSSPSEQPQTFMQRLATALVYVLAFPFIAIFIGLKRVVTQQKEPPHSYRNRLPAMKNLGPSQDAKGR
ncbi:uncharacterized protein BDZ99DRAFT_461886 [Mytilinidion resinicola]|uniref:Uncharacterized protein n=1 Tax=Mytilinidion resinicola TaxID=574789 RepID=A0A6A6YVB7_9PEZI|nr:uncharacterized protein BDZ99DRAFT_461886 [Mytilinidion resinicola]KAF2811934.1 hypothetical protein BDZ99DRAFT_461886 [Mytilinidion resinicola]